MAQLAYPDLVFGAGFEVVQVVFPGRLVHPLKPVGLILADHRPPFHIVGLDRSVAPARSPHLTCSQPSVPDGASSSGPFSEKGMRRNSFTRTMSLSDQERPWLEKVNAVVVPGLFMAKVFLLAPVPISSTKLPAPRRPSEGVVPDSSVHTENKVSSDKSYCSGVTINSWPCAR